MKKTIIIFCILFFCGPAFSQSYWERMQSVFNYDDVAGFVNRSSTVLLATKSAGVFVSPKDDNGSYSWTKFSISAKEITGISGSMSFFAVSSLDQSCKLYRDDGTAWDTPSIPNSPPIISVSVIDNSIVLAGTNKSGLYYLSAPGEQWQHKILDSSTVYCTYKYPIAGYCFAGTDSCIYISTNNALNWAKVDVSPKAKINGFGHYGNYLFAATDSGLYKSTDWGHKWYITSFTNKVNYFKVINDYKFFSTETGIYYLGWDYNYYEQRSMKGKSVKEFDYNILHSDTRIYSKGSLYFDYPAWVSDNSTNNGLPESLVTDMIKDQSSCYYYLVDSILLWRNDSLNTIKHCINGLSQCGVTSVVKFTNSLYLLSQSNGDLFISTDPKNNWSLLMSFGEAFTKLVKVDDSKLYGFTKSNKIYRLSEIGYNWESLNYPESLIPRSIAQVNNNIAVSTYSGVVYSSDNGLNWSQSNLPQITMSEIIRTKSGRLYVAGLNGSVYYSDNGGAYWVQAGKDAPSTVNSIFATDGGNIFVATGGSGVYYSYNNGLTWNIFNTGLYAGHILKLFSPSAGELFAIPRGNKIYKTNLLPTAIEEKDKETLHVELSQNFPNPFVTDTYINFSLGLPQKVKLEVFNTLGEVITTLCNNELSAGNHSICFKANNLCNGVYFYKLTTNNDVYVKKMIVVK